MRPKDIVIGKQYKHRDFHGITYRGVGYDTERGRRVRYLIIDSLAPDFGHKIVVPPEVKRSKSTKKDSYNFWKKFYPV